MHTKRLKISLNLALSLEELISRKLSLKVNQNKEKCSCAQILFYFICYQILSLLTLLTGKRMENTFCYPYITEYSGPLKPIFC
jgi:hypothetical protein